MIRYVAFLRGINVSGQKNIRMEDLRGFVAMPGLKNIATYIQTGNVLFDTDETNEELLTRKLEKQLEDKLGYKVNVILRSLKDLKSIIDNNPYEHIKNQEKPGLYVTFLSETPAFEVCGSLGIYSNDAEYASKVNKEVYVVSPNYGKTCFSNTFIEKKLGVVATTRNWNTVNKLVHL
jgi:uncharacterized protein (DUF1697 family)